MDIPFNQLQISCGVYVLSTRSGETDNACIINSLQQHTQTPPRVSVTVNKNALTHKLLSQSSVCSISILAENADLSTIHHFGIKSGRQQAKFTSAPARLENGVAYLIDSCCAVLGAKVFSQFDLDTHTLFLADITDFQQLSDMPPLIYADYCHRDASAKNRGWRCSICGYICGEKTLPQTFSCPWCGQHADVFRSVRQ